MGSKNSSKIYLKQSEHDISLPLCLLLFTRFVAIYGTYNIPLFLLGYIPLLFMSYLFKHCRILEYTRNTDEHNAVRDNTTTRQMHNKSLNVSLGIFLIWKPVWRFQGSLY